MKTYVLIIAVLLFMSQEARADIPPPPGYVEQCTVEKQTGPGRTCETCSTSRRDEPGTCGTKLGAGFTQRCRARGATVWSEVWCRADTGADAGLVDGGTSDETPARGRGTLSPARLDGGVALPVSAARVSEAVEPDALADDGCSALGRRDGSGLSLVLMLAGLLLARRKRA